MNVQAILALRPRLAGFVVVLAAAIGLAQAAAATTAPVVRVFVVQVPSAQDHDFIVGVKTYEKCLSDHGTQQATYVYDAETGDLTRYLFLNEYSTWAGMDAHDAAGTACRDVFGTEVLPHVGQAFSQLAVLDPKDTYMPGGDPDPAPMLWVDSYRIKPGQGQEFNAAMQHLAAAAAKTHWEGRFAGYDIAAGGRGAQDFVQVWPNKSWADAGREPSPSPMKMVASVYGAASLKSGHRKFLATIAEHWSDTWSYDKDLSVIPGK
ncbi:MAG TPA: hypothetical protein VIY50_15015 [Steroidobacteraceae bacterium]